MTRLSCLLLLALAPLSVLAQNPPLPPAATSSIAPAVAVAPVSPNDSCERAITTPFKNYASAVASIQKMYPSHMLFSESLVSCKERNAMLFLLIDPTGVQPSRTVAIDIKSMSPSPK